MFSVYLSLDWPVEHFLSNWYLFFLLMSWANHFHWARSVQCWRLRKNNYFQVIIVDKKSLPSIVKRKRTMCGMKFISKSFPWKYIFGDFSAWETRDDGVIADIVTRKLPRVMCDKLVFIIYCEVMTWRSDSNNNAVHPDILVLGGWSLAWGKKPEQISNICVDRSNIQQNQWRSQFYYKQLK